MPGVLDTDDIADIRSLVQELAMPDICERMVATPGVNADDRTTATAYQPGETYPCAFSWGTDNDRTAESASNLTSSTPRMLVPMTATFTSRDRVRLTHQFGQIQTPPVEFKVAGQPLPGLRGIVLELARVST